MCVAHIIIIFKDFIMQHKQTSSKRREGRNVAQCEAYEFHFILFSRLILCMCYGQWQVIWDHQFFLSSRVNFNRSRSSNQTPIITHQVVWCAFGRTVGEHNYVFQSFFPVILTSLFGKKGSQKNIVSICVSAIEIKYLPFWLLWTGKSQKDQSRKVNL